MRVGRPSSRCQTTSESSDSRRSASPAPRRTASSKTYCCGDVPREDALERLTDATVTAHDGTRWDRVELDINESGDPVSWLDQEVGHA